jgi:large subunit ribosomal protein L13
LLFFFFVPEEGRAQRFRGGVKQARVQCRATGNPEEHTVKTFVPKEGELVKKWHLIDAEGQVLGRVAVEAARLIRGKHKPNFTPHMDCGDHVIIINAEKAVVTGKKMDQKKYYTHSWYFGGLSEATYREMLAKHPTRAMLAAVQGMLPHNRLGRKLAKHVRVYAGPDHHQEAQTPQPYVLSKKPQE